MEKQLRLSTDRERIKSMKNYVIEKVKELMSAPSCCAEAKAACQSWLDAIGTDREAEEARKLLAELEEDIIPIDGLIAFADSEAGENVFGKEKAGQVAAHAREIKAAGAKYCDCAACAAVAEILDKKEAIL